MFEYLAGRLTWEQMPEGINVEIPARFDWQIFPDATILLVWTVGA